jgi:hypothetical protein
MMGGGGKVVWWHGCDGEGRKIGKRLYGALEK